MSDSKIADRVLKRISKTKTIDPSTHIEFFGSVPYKVVTKKKEKELDSVIDQVQKYLGPVHTVGKWKKSKDTFEISFKL